MTKWKSNFKSTKSWNVTSESGKKLEGNYNVLNKSNSNNRNDSENDSNAYE